MTAIKYLPWIITMFLTVVLSSSIEWSRGKECHLLEVKPIGVTWWECLGFCLVCPADCMSLHFISFSLSTFLITKDKENEGCRENALVTVVLQLPCRVASPRLALSPSADSFPPFPLLPLAAFFRENIKYWRSSHGVTLHISRLVAVPSQREILCPPLPQLPLTQTVFTFIFSYFLWRPQDRTL